MKRYIGALISIVALAALGPNTVVSQPPASAPTSQPSEKAETPPAAVAPSSQPDAGEGGQDSDRERKLASYLNGVKFVGKFTIDGKEDADAKTEEYTISACEKLDEKDMYRLTARIKYGDVDSEVPLDVKILWSGKTPVITLDSFWIPGMGTFGARVLIHSDRYAGTWQHDAVGGHLFGKIEKVKP